MKKVVAFLTMLVVLTINAFAQAGAYSSTVVKTKNVVLLYRAIGDVNIPTMLHSPKNGKVVYCWYPTRMAFGENVRTSETPDYKEEGTYTDGRLTFYKQGAYYYRIKYAADGCIERIIKYNSSGDELENTSLASEKLYWTSYKKLDCPGKGLVSPSSVYISNVLLNREYKSSSYVSLSGYCIEGSKLVLKRAARELTKVSGQLAKKWVMDDGGSDMATIYDDGRIKSSSSFRNFDFSDTVGNSSYVE